MLNYIVNSISDLIPILEYINIFQIMEIYQNL